MRVFVWSSASSPDWRTALMYLPPPVSVSSLWWKRECLCMCLCMRACRSRVGAALASFTPPPSLSVCVCVYVSLRLRAWLSVPRILLPVLPFAPHLLGVFVFRFALHLSAARRAAPSLAVPNPGSVMLPLSPISSSCLSLYPSSADPSRYQHTRTKKQSQRTRQQHAARLHTHSENRS